MGRYILKIPNEDLYFEYSTVVDAPVSKAFPLCDFEIWYGARHGSVGLKGLKERIDRANSSGSSCFYGETFEEAISCNRYGDNETELSVDDFIAKLKMESAQ